MGGGGRSIAPIGPPCSSATRSRRTSARRCSRTTWARSRRSSMPTSCVSTSRSAACRKASSSRGGTRSSRGKGRWMADLVGVFAASNGRILAGDWETMPRDHRDRLAAAFDEIGRRLKACRPDLLVVISPDHWVNFFISNLPAVCIGIGDEHDGPPEPFMKKVFPRERLKGHAAFGRHLLETALNDDFEPALSHRLKLDHGTCIPLWRIGVDAELPIVPVIVNDLEEPMPSIRRCLAWGRLLRQAIESYPEPLRMAVLGTGGLSHSIGEPTMGWIDEEFDHCCIKHFEEGEDARLTAFLTDALARTGNGAHEIRDWVIAHAAAGSKGFELIDYFPSPQTLVGAGFASWRAGGGAQPPGRRPRLFRSPHERGPREASNVAIAPTGAPR